MNKYVKIIALTGALGSGKSTVASIFKNLGAEIVDADLLARMVVQPGSQGLQKIVEQFGQEYLSIDGSLDRKRMAELVFNNPDKKKCLEDIIHPLIKKVALEIIEKIKANCSSNQIIIYVTPLYYESKVDYLPISKVIVVSAPVEESISRVVKRDQCSMESAQLRYKSQIPISEKVKKGDFVIENDKGLKELESQVRAVYQAIKDLPC